MIIPVCCFTCGHVLADKYRYFQRECKKVDEQDDKGKPSTSSSTEFKNIDPKTRGHILDELKLNRICCRRMMISTVDMMDII